MRGVWKVRMLHCSASVSNEQKPSSPSSAEEGRSAILQSDTLCHLPDTFSHMPYTNDTQTRFLQVDSLFFWRSRSTAWRYCSTAPALHPGQLLQVIPACWQYAVSMWSKPMVAVPINRTLLPSSNSRLQIVRVRIIKASASLTTSGVKAFPGR